MYIHKNESRRAFLRQASAFTAMVGSGAAPLAMNLAAMGNAAAQTAGGGYKAIVCLFMSGGNDSFNMVLPTDSASWGAYSRTRTQSPDSLALMPRGMPAVAHAALGSPARLGGVLPLTLAESRRDDVCALHPVMTGVQRLFNQQKLAVLANIGPLVQPTTRTTFSNGSVVLPKLLFSHNDQQNMWQSMEGEGAMSGWGGKLVDEFFASASSAPALFSSVSLGGDAVWLTGARTKRIGVGTAGTLPLGVRPGEGLFGSPAAGAALHNVATMARMSNTNLFERDVAAVNRRTIEAESLLRHAILPANQAPFGTPSSGPYSAAADPKLQYVNPVPQSWQGPTAFNPTAEHLQMVARMIDAGVRSPAISGNRQIFFVDIGGFDTHSWQNHTHTELMARVDHALAYFNQTLEELGQLRGQDFSSMVTTFTASDFGRTFTSNGDGTDHGWGAHHFVMGGAVNGGRIFGGWPTLVDRGTTGGAFGGSEFQLTNGSLVPTTSVDHLGATLARWFGVSPTSVATVFPNLRNWNTTAQTLNFYKV